MMIRPLAFCAGLALAWCGTAEAACPYNNQLNCYEAPQSLPALYFWEVQARDLCVNGHPAKRSSHVTYGGLLPKHGYQRDHYVSLGLGGPDTRDNVHYQRCNLTGLHGRCESGPAADKDADEHKAEEKMCEQHWSPDYARQWLAHNWPIDAAHGYNAE